jgi:hypothetical protein
MRLPADSKDGQWLCHLRDLAQQWVKDNATDQKPPMDAYVDLFFSFGLARLGEADAAKELLDRAAAALAGRDDAHTFLLEAYHYRITQAMEGKPHGGPLPAELLATLKRLGTLPNYVVDHLRRKSRILEPDQEINPYRWFGPVLRHAELDFRLAELADLVDREEIESRVHKLLEEAHQREGRLDPRAQVLHVALQVAPRVGWEFAREMLEAAQNLYAAMPEPRDANQLAERAAFLEKTLFVAAYFDRTGDIQTVVDRFEHLLRGYRGSGALAALEKLARGCFRSLRHLGKRDQTDRLLGLIQEQVMEGKDLVSVDPAGLRLLVLVAGEWYFFGRGAQAEPVLQATRARLLKGDLPWREQNALARTYARAVGQAPAAVARPRLEEIFTSVEGVKDTYTTTRYFSISQTELIEAAVLAVVEAWKRTRPDHVFDHRGEAPR